MQIDPATLSKRDGYFLMVSAIVPRPIAWVLSEHADGRLNLAPFSYFNGVSSDPPLVMLSIGSKRDGLPKDTRANILERKQFVVHIVHSALLEPMNLSSAEVGAEVSEVRTGRQVIQVLRQCATKLRPPLAHRSGIGHRPGLGQIFAPHRCVLSQGIRPLFRYPVRK